MEPLTVKFCDDCEATLESILEFRKQCLNSISSLSGNLQLNTVFVKEEEEIDSYDHVEVKIEEGSVEMSPEKPVKRGRKPKVTQNRERKTVTKKPTAKKASTAKVKPSKSKSTKDEMFCSICNENVHQFSTHVLIHTTLDENKQYKCNICAETCTDVRALKLHFDTHSEHPEQSKCPDCDAPLDGASDCKCLNKNENEKQVEKKEVKKDSVRSYCCEHCGE